MLHTHSQRQRFLPRPTDEEPFFTATAMGLVGTGRSPSEARASLMEKIRQAGEA